VQHPRLAAVGDFVRSMRTRTLDPALLDAAKQSFVDWFAVSIAALSDPAPSIVRAQMLRWGTQGRAVSLYGDRLAAAPAALVNGTAAHSLDYDDVHLGTAYHASAPTLAAVLAVANDRGLDSHAVLAAFVAGFEVGTALGDAGVGVALADRGWHPTGILGHFSATAAIAALLDLDTTQIADALGLAATQMAGLQASGGSMAKPFHVGKAAMNGILSAELALDGLQAERRLLDDADRGVLGCLFQKPTLAAFDALGSSWQLLRNSFKPYAACQLTHAAFETSASLAEGFSAGGLNKVRAYVNPLAPKVASRLRPASPMEGKFSIPYCVALGLKGHRAAPNDFTPERMADAALLDLTDLVEVVPDERVERWQAKVELRYADGSTRDARIESVLGSTARPLAWPDLEAKFAASVEPALGADAKALLDVLRGFEAEGQVARVAQIIERNRARLDALQMRAAR